MEMLSILIYLAKKGALCRPVGITTSHVGKELGMSQQSVSRWLMTLEKRGYMERNKGIRGYMVQITTPGKSYMRDVKQGLEHALSATDKLIIKGRVISGMGEGQYYIGLDGYKKGINENLGFVPYPGTLNLKLKTLRECQFKERLAATKGVMVPSFTGNKRTFGSLKCFHCRLDDIYGAVIIPERSHYGNDVIEIVSSHNLREKMKLKDGNDISIEVTMNENL